MDAAKFSSQKEKKKKEQSAHDLPWKASGSFGAQFIKAMTHENRIHTGDPMSL